ncbi:hypothetical protein [Streptomyces sp. NPDC018693]|uniref:hypothetical protein n=1 Tax=unclassified Streptomyces TaxID=2593676 RepID=UPI0037B87472
MAAGLGAVALLLGALTWLPANLPLPKEDWATGTILALVVPTALAALLRLALARPDLHAAWLALRCIPGRVQAVLGALLLSGIALALLTWGTGGSPAPAKEEDGLYFVYTGQRQQVSPGRYKGLVREVSRDQYAAAVDHHQRTVCAFLGLLSVGAACVTLTTGEVRRADATTPRATSTP